MKGFTIQLPNVNSQSEIDLEDVYQQIAQLKLKAKDLQEQIDNLDTLDLKKILEHRVIDEEHVQTVTGNTDFTLNYPFILATLEIDLGGQGLARGEALTEEDKATMSEEERAKKLKDYIALDDGQTVRLTIAPHVKGVIQASYYKAELLN